MTLNVFPTVSSSRFPKLIYLRAHRNNFQDVQYPFYGMSVKMWQIHINSANMRSADGVETLTNLFGLRITGNQLESVPDLTGSSKLCKLQIADNSRMTCDYLMCWRRLWDHVRQPLEVEDDVVCVKPLFLAGNTLSSINPKFMQCEKGKVTKQYLHTCFPSYQFTNLKYLTTIARPDTILHLITSHLHLISVDNKPNLLLRILKFYLTLNIDCSCAFRSSLFETHVFRSFFDGYYNALVNDPMHLTVNEIRYKIDFNYDIVIQTASNKFTST